MTWRIPFLFRTPPGWELYVRGPTNTWKDGAFPLDGIVETDWAVATFTMNWRITRPGHSLIFEAGEPICMVLPFRCTDLEQWRSEIRDVASEPKLLVDYTAWRDSRDKFNSQNASGGVPGWQKHYYTGKSPNGTRGTHHRTELNLAEFVEMQRD